MIEKFINRWELKKDKLREILSKTKMTSDYESLVKLVIERVYNTDDYGESYTNLTTLDFGDYQGTLIFVFTNDVYQPSVEETYYTSVHYGSCSGCDTLLSICEYYDELPNERQLNELMTLCLHLVQNTKVMKEL